MDSKLGTRQIAGKTGRIWDFKGPNYGYGRFFFVNASEGGIAFRQGDGRMAASVGQDEAADCKRGCSVLLASGSGPSKPFAKGSCL